MIKKLLLLGLFPFTILSAHSQSSLPDNFKIGNSVEVYSQDSLKIYFNCTGTIVEKQCASFYRIGKMDSTSVNVVGKFYDFDMNNKLYLKANMQNNKFEGYACYYFNNGKISEEGNYKNNSRTGKWIYYYRNGRIEKIYNHDSVEPTVVEAYKQNGKATVVNGTGKMYTALRNYLQCSNIDISGDVLNGKKHGEWKYSIVGTEMYQEGNFIKGISGNYVYTDKPKITFTKFYPNENLKLIENALGCPGDRYSLAPQYDNSVLHKKFYPTLQEAINKESTTTKDQWLVIGIKISKNNLLQRVNIASSINDTTLERRIYSITQTMTNWKTPVVNSKEIEFNLYFSLLVYNNRIIVLPDYVYKKKYKQ